MKLVAGAAMVAAGVMNANGANVAPAMSVARPGDARPSGPVREAVLAKDLDPASIVVKRGAMPSVWDWPANSPLTLETTDADGAPLVLVPYGCTKLRISAFAVR